MTMAPAASRRATQVAAFAGLIGEGGTGRRGGQSLDVDVVLHRDRHAVERKIGVAGGRKCFGLKRLGLRERVRFVPQRDEHGGIVVGADARVAVRNRGFGRGRAGPMRRHDRGDRVAGFHGVSRAIVTPSLPSTLLVGWVEPCETQLAAPCWVSP